MGLVLHSIEWGKESSQGVEVGRCLTMLNNHPQGVGRRIPEGVDRCLSRVINHSCKGLGKDLPGGSSYVSYYVDQTSSRGGEKDPSGGQ